MGTTRNSGVNLCTSLTQVPTTLDGATTRNGGAGSAPFSSVSLRESSRARAIIASVCTVLPNPMSSARTPPNPCSCRKVSHW